MLGSIYNKKTIGQPVRQQDMSAAMGDVSQSRPSRGALRGANNVFKGKIYKRYAIVPPLLCMNQEYISALKSERLPLCWCALILFTVYIILNIII